MHSCKHLTCINWLNCHKGRDTIACILYKTVEGTCPESHSGSGKYVAIDKFYCLGFY